ncbi:MAG: rRNA maturation RNase YbeY [Pseudomonadota bacterium]
MSEKNKLALAVQYSDPRLKDSITRAKLRRWVQASLFAPAELTIRFVDADEGRQLNKDYRGKDYATNVLTFAYGDDVLGDAEMSADEPTRADIILCTDALLREASEQGKTLEAHTMHLVIHGVLHAQGYDHESEEEAGEMEGIETDILAALGVANPYLVDTAR